MYGVCIVENGEGELRETRKGPAIRLKEVQLKEGEVKAILRALKNGRVESLEVVKREGIKAVILPDIYSWLRRGRQFSPSNFENAPGFVNNTIIVLANEEIFEDSNPQKGERTSLERVKLQVSAWMAFCVGGYYKKRSRYPWGD